MHRINRLNIVFIIQLVFFGLIITSLLPREASILLALGLIVYISVTPIEEATIFFVRSIPFFVAIPITANYDSLNTWRILSIILFIKLAHITGLKYFYRIYSFSRHSKLFLLLFSLAIISIFPAVEKGEAVKRIIYFLNLSLPGLTIYFLVKNNKIFTEKLIKNITIPTILVVLVGYLQILSTYFIDIYQFMKLWGEGIQLRQFGTLWSEIAVRLGNTWFAYYGDQLSLRVFSLFPDSHSFPQFVLLGISSLFAVSILRLSSDPSILNSFKNMIRTRVSLNIIWVVLAFLIAILSGTRGIWAASLGVLIIILSVIYWMHRGKVDVGHKNIFKYLSSFLVVFFMLFAVAYPIFVSPQFLLAKNDLGLFKQRLKSIIDFGETSNSQRLEIWKASLESIKKRPLLGVGIGNFPVVLDQRVFLARAGSSAHNIYLHIASELGIPALLTVVWLMWLVFKKTYFNFLNEKDPLFLTYYGGTIIFLPWVLIYSLTDVALFDERAFLLFITTICIILAHPNTKNLDSA